jgi:hypothetical protein
MIPKKRFIPIIIITVFGWLFMLFITIHFYFLSGEEPMVFLMMGMPTVIFGGFIVLAFIEDGEPEGIF